MPALVLIAAYPFMSGPVQDVTLVLFAAGIVVPVLIGYRRRDPRMTTQWILLLAAQSLGAVANAFERVPLDLVWQGTAVAIAKNVVNILLLAAAIGVVVRRGRNNLGRLIDATLVALALGGLLWTAIVKPGAAASTLTAGSQVGLAVILMVLGGTLGALLQLMGSDPANRALQLLFAALALKLVGYVIIALTGELTHAFGIMAYLGGWVALGLAVVNPAIHRLAQPGPARPHRLGVARLALLGVALLAVPVAVGLRAMTDMPISGTFLIIATALTVLLVMFRVGLLAAELHRSERALRLLASRDPLTSVLNRREFTIRLETELAEGRDCALIFVDLDSFKEVNDRYGHLVGDRLLVEVADRLRVCVGPDDLIARFGGDEFVLLMHAPTTADVVGTEACIAEAFGRPYDASGAPVRISASVGAVISDAELRFATAEQLISQADAAMYARKRRPVPPSTVQPLWEPAN